MMPWSYYWWNLNQYIDVYLRIRLESTLDGMAKPYCETLAYVQRQPGGSRALLHGDNDQVYETDAIPAGSRLEVIERIEKYFTENES